MYRKKNQTQFYSVQEICPELSIFNKNYNQICFEVDQIVNQSWIQWPEKNLYENNKEWTVFPFYAFDTWNIDNCQKLPTITKLLIQIPNLKTALLSRTSPGTKLTPHRGWKNLSNYIMRCHFGIYIPENKSSVHVIKDNREYKQNHKNNSWLIFDDSELHWSENNSTQDRIILIVDVLRPNHIPLGTSDVEDTSELTELIQNFKKKSNEYT
jgi:beta-hydroxylase